MQRDSFHARVIRDCGAVVEIERVVAVGEGKWETVTGEATPRWVRKVNQNTGDLSGMIVTVRNDAQEPMVDAGSCR
jgi:hypothetical protein